jgi:hypothetical protein
MVAHIWSFAGKIFEKFCLVKWFCNVADSHSTLFRVGDSFVFITTETSAVIEIESFQDSCRKNPLQPKRTITIAIPAQLMLAGRRRGG